VSLYGASNFILQVSFCSNNCRSTRGRTRFYYQNSFSTPPTPSSHNRLTRVFAWYNVPSNFLPAKQATHTSPGPPSPSQRRWLWNRILHLALLGSRALRLHVDNSRLELHQPDAHRLQNHLLPHLRPRPRHHRRQPVRLQLPPLHVQEPDVHA
jgi:hypothetical protein